MSNYRGLFSAFFYPITSGGGGTDEVHGGGSGVGLYVVIAASITKTSRADAHQLAAIRASCRSKILFHLNNVEIGL